jgi:hypothetical protein
MMGGIISEVGVDWIRYDFNIDPLSGWTLAENDETRGLAQIRYINGLYTLHNPQVKMEILVRGGG